MVTIENNKLIFSGRIDSSNAAQFEEELFGLYKGGDAVIDAKDLTYISSAGLRVIMKLRKQTANVTLENVSLDVYNVFEMTGFTELITVKKALRFVSIEGLEEIGKGGHGKVYKLTDDMIIKTYHDGSSLERIDMERELGRNAFVNGIPCAIAFDVVRCEAGYGVIFEMAGAQTLSKFITEHPEKVQEYGVKFAELMKKLNSVQADTKLYGSIKDVYKARIEVAKEFFTEEEYGYMLRLLNAIPEHTTMVHGDYHPNNVMVNAEGELMLIDMADISYGSPLFDIGGTATTMLLNGQSNPEMTKLTIGLEHSLANQMWNILLLTYFKDSPMNNPELNMKRLGAFSLFRAGTHMGGTARGRELAPRILAAMRQGLFSNIDGVEKLFSMPL